ncbi:MAG: hypothetical protein ACOH2T_17580 [Pseudomonas sp.]
MSTYLNRKSLMGCIIAIGLLGGTPSMVLAGEESGEHSHATPAISTDRPGTMAKANDSKPDHGSMDHSKMSYESMDHDQKTKKVD